jgi:hypothetical protein
LQVFRAHVSTLSAKVSSLATMVSVLRAYDLPNSPPIGSPLADPVWSARKAPRIRSFVETRV